MAAPQLARASSLKLAPALAALSREAKTLGQALEERHRMDLEAGPSTAAEAAVPASRAQPNKSFALHIGAELRLPTPNRLDTHTYDPMPAQVQAERAAARDPFEGLPLKAWADRMGERVMPAFEAVKEEKRRANLEAVKRRHEITEVPVPKIPHLLPFTRWAAKNEKFQETFIAKNGKDRPKARLSWYHPDDTMVPRGWWKMGLLEDMKYYAPFGIGKPKATVA
eukprot:jgi/Astpho2/601/Aster-04449